MLINKVFVVVLYWVDVYMERGGRVWYWKIIDDVIVFWVIRDVIRVYLCYIGYMVSWVVIVIWNEVIFYGVSGKYI